MIKGETDEYLMNRKSPHGCWIHDNMTEMLDILMLHGRGIWALILSSTSLG